MFACDQDTALRALRKLGAQLCCYSLGDPVQWEAGTCDCKYGGDGIGSPNMGEQTGCPELRTTVALLAAMTPLEYSEVVRRTGTAPGAACTWGGV